MAVKKAVVIKTEDVDKDGNIDLSIYAEGNRFFTVYNLKRVGVEAIATCAAVFCALVGHSIIM